MDELNQSKLTTRFPQFFRDRMFYFECGNGHFQMLYACMQRWEQILHSAPGGGCDVKLEQVKTKYGNLRIYWNVGHDQLCSDALYRKLAEVVAIAESDANHTCSVCGRWAALYQMSAWADKTCFDCKE